MAYSLTRLTLFAIISSIEQDLRQQAILHLKDHISAAEIFTQDVYEKCLDRYIKENGYTSEKPNVEGLIIFADLADVYQALNMHRGYLPSNISSYIRDTTPELEKLVPVRNRIVHSRPLNYDDLPTTLEIAEKFSKARTDIWDNLSETLLRLKEEPSFVLNLEVPSYYAESFIENFNLPIPDFDETGFIGRDQQIRDVLRYCLGPYPVITLVGEGMLGKTALALRIAYNILDLPKRPFDSIVWTSSKTAMLTPTEIIKIKGAITSSLSLFNQAASELSRSISNDPRFWDVWTGKEERKIDWKKIANDWQGK